MPASAKILVFTSCASVAEAQRLAQALIERRQAACVQISSAGVNSTYRWKDQIETANEYPVLVKTTRAKFSRVERTIRELHSYKVPEILAVAAVAGSRDYLSWIDSSLSSEE